MLKQALAVVALVGLAGCSAGVAVDPNRTSSRSDYDRDNAQVTYRSSTDTNDSTNARTYDRTYDRKTTTYDRSYDANARVASDRSDAQPIQTDPIGRPELMSRKLDNDIQNELRSQYVLGFYPPEGVKPGSKWREISVQTSEGKAKTIRGYYP